MISVTSTITIIFIILYGGYIAICWVNEKLVKLCVKVHAYPVSICKVNDSTCFIQKDSLQTTTKQP